MSAPVSTVNDADNWRKNIQQSYRSGEINNIAKVLASLEPGASAASKLMLASQFENMMFTAASDLADYKKKINKKLKKMQKNYKATEVPNKVILEQQKDGIVLLQRRLKSLYGEKLEMIVEKGRLTVEQYEEKVGKEKSKTLRDHIDTAIGWAADIGAVPNEKAILVATGQPVRLHNRSPQDNLEHLRKVEKDLEKKVDNIRGYVLKLTKPDLFFAERLEEMEQNVLLNINSSVCQAFVDGVSQALKSAGINAQTTSALLNNAATEAIAAAPADKDTGVQVIKDLMENIRKVIPFPGNKHEEKEAMLTHLNRIRVAVQVCVKYSILAPKDPNTKLQLAGNLRKVHEAVYESITFLRHVYREDRSREGDSLSILLEDAWNKHMDYDRVMTDVGAAAEIGGSGENQQLSNIERMNTDTRTKGPKPVVIRSKILFTKRLPPNNLLDAMKRKKVTVCGNGNSSYLKMQFGEAFEMSVYFSPLLVTIRALPDAVETNKFERSKFRRNVVDCNLGIWSPPSFALKTTPLQVRVRQNNTQQQHNMQHMGKKRNAGGQVLTRTKQTVSVMGLSADVAFLGPIVSKKLEYASAQATRCLRRCFAEHTHRSTSDFEIEISEGNAVLKFLQLARNTYD